MLLLENDFSIFFFIDSFDSIKFSENLEIYRGFFFVTNIASLATNALHVVVCSGIIGRSRKDFKKYLFNFIAAMPLVSVISLKIFT